MRRVVATLVVFALLRSSPTLACSCITPGSPSEEAARATAVFLGEVTAVHDSQPANTWWNRLRWRLGWGPDPNVYDSSRPVHYVFRIIEPFKGTQSRSVKVTSSADGASCGIQFDRGGRYVVYAGGSPDALRAGHCSLTGPAADPRSGLRWLRAHRKEITGLGVDPSRGVVACHGVSA